MVDQTLFNVILGCAAALGGWWMRTMWEAIQHLQSADDKITDKLGEVEILVIGEYVRKADMELGFDKLNKKLDRIFDKLDGKVDK